MIQAFSHFSLQREDTAIKSWLLILKIPNTPQLQCTSTKKIDAALFYSPAYLHQFACTTNIERQVLYAGHPNHTWQIQKYIM